MHKILIILIILIIFLIAIYMKFNKFKRIYNSKKIEKNPEKMDEDLVNSLNVLIKTAN